MKSRLIEKKIWPRYFKLVKSGKKRFEIRLADFRVIEGDTLLLREWDQKKKKYTGRSLRKKVTYVKYFALNEHGQKKQIMKKGLYVMQL